MDEAAARGGVDVSAAASLAVRQAVNEAVLICEQIESGYGALPYWAARVRQEELEGRLREVGQRLWARGGPDGVRQAEERIAATSTHTHARHVARAWADLEGDGPAS
jgi:hypothetical protein